MKKFKVGDAVTLKNEIWEEDKQHRRQATTIRSFLPDVKGGVVLSEYLAGHQCWNVADLVHWTYKRKKA